MTNLNEQRKDELRKKLGYPLDTPDSERPEIVPGKYIAKVDFTDTIREIRDQILPKSRKVILSLLKKRFDDKTAIQYEEVINKSTLSTLMERYTIDEYLDIDSVDYKNAIDIDKIRIEYPDVSGWIRIWMATVSFHSLGDTMGYKDADWEFNEGNVHAKPEYINEMIYQFISLGGVNDIRIRNWKASDDTIMYLATLDVLLTVTLGEHFTSVGERFRQAYLDCQPLMVGRDPGQTTLDSLAYMERLPWDGLQYNPRSIGNGSAMRSGCIGLICPGYTGLVALIRLSIVSSCITHNSATAIMASITAAVFTSYAIEKKPVASWPHRLLKLMKSGIIDTLVKMTVPKIYEPFQQDKIIYIGQWQTYVSLRFSGLTPKFGLKHMINPVLRFQYLKENFSKGCGTPGGCGDDCMIMAYDAVLESNGVFEKLIVYSILHPGDSDTVGAVAFSWFAAYYFSSRLETMTNRLIRDLEFKDRINNLLLKHFSEIVSPYYGEMYLNVALKHVRKYGIKINTSDFSNVILE